VNSPAFADGKRIPTEHATTAAGGRNLSIPLEWTNAPEGTQSYAIEVIDLHPLARQWVHWLAVDVPAETTRLEAGASTTAMPPGARELENGFGVRGWGGPQPPRGTGPHEYRATVYALDSPSVELATRASLDEFRAALEPITLGSASVSGTFER
jgi:Raf kinase inhibitor-like YbhB/YbcL family protein